MQIHKFNISQKIPEGCIDIILRWLVIVTVAAVEDVAERKGQMKIWVVVMSPPKVTIILTLPL